MGSYENKIGKFQFIKKENMIPLEKYLSISALAAKCKKNESTSNYDEESKRIRKTFDLSHLEPKLREKYYTLLIKYADVISKTPFDLGRCSIYEHKITLRKDAVPKYSKQFSLPQAHIDFLETYVKELVDVLVEAYAHHYGYKRSSTKNHKPQAE